MIPILISGTLFIGKIVFQIHFGFIMDEQKCSERKDCQQEPLRSVKDDKSQKANNADYKERFVEKIIEYRGKAYQLNNKEV